MHEELVRGLWAANTSHAAGSWQGGSSLSWGICQHPEPPRTCTLAAIGLFTCWSPRRDASTDRERQPSLGGGAHAQASSR